MRTVMASGAICIAFLAASVFARWLSVLPAHYDPLGAYLVSGGLFTIAIAVLIRD
jgi:hypothetical protein